MFLLDILRHLTLSLSTRKELVPALIWPYFEIEPDHRQDELPAVPKKGGRSKKHDEMEF